MPFVAVDRLVLLSPFISRRLRQCLANAVNDMKGCHRYHLPYYLGTITFRYRVYFAFAYHP